MATFGGGRRVPPIHSPICCGTDAATNPVLPQRMIALPHFLLYAESGRQHERGDWHFVLEPIDGGDCVEAFDYEPQLSGERLELLTVVRGLEALDSPARVTVLTPSRYVTRGLTLGLDEWRASGWTWEAFGRMTPVKNADLWQRVDQAQKYHQLECRRWRFDAAHLSTPLESISAETDDRAALPTGPAAASRSGRSLRRALLEYRRRTGERIDAIRLSLAQLGTGLSPSPWLG